MICQHFDEINTVPEKTLNMFSKHINVIKS